MNYSPHVLTENEKSLLYKSLNFAIPPKTLEYADYLLPFELLYRDIHNLDITNEKKEVLKTKIKNCAFSSFNSYNENGAPLNLTPEEFAALKSFSKNKNLIIQKSDKGNSIAITAKSYYLEKMRNILSDSSKFTQVSVAEDKQVNFTVSVEKHITDLPKDFKNSEVVSETVYKSLKPRGRKVHKQLVDNCSPYRPIMSAIKKPTYNLAKVLVPVLELITTNMYTVKTVLNLPKKLLTRTQDFSWPVWMSSPFLPTYH